MKPSFDAPKDYPFMHAVGQKVFIVGRESECDFDKKRKGANAKTVGLDLQTLKLRKLKSQNAPNCLSDSASTATRNGIAYFGENEIEVESSNEIVTTPKSSPHFAQALHYPDMTKESWRRAILQMYQCTMAMSYPHEDGATLEIADKKFWVSQPANNGSKNKRF
jgi:hypothetical protein